MHVCRRQERARLLDMSNMLRARVSKLGDRKTAVSPDRQPPPARADTEAASKATAAKVADIAAKKKPAVSTFKETLRRNIKRMVAERLSAGAAPGEQDKEAQLEVGGRTAVHSARPAKIAASDKLTEGQRRAQDAIKAQSSARRTRVASVRNYNVKDS